MDRAPRCSSDVCEAQLRELAPEVPETIEVERMVSRAHRIAAAGLRPRARSWRALSGALVSVMVVVGVAFVAGRFYLEAGGGGARLTDAGSGERLVAPVLGTDERATGYPGAEGSRASSASPAHGASIDIFAGDWPPGVSLSQALATIGWKPVLPDEALVGKPVKVVVDDLGKVDPKTFGLLIKYESGVRLYTRYGETDFAEELALRGPPSPGHPVPVIEEVGGRASVVNPGDYTITPVVSWSMRGYTYSLRSGEASVDIEDLKRIAASMK